MFTYLDVSSNLTRSTLYFFSLTNPKNLKMGKTILQWIVGFLTGTLKGLVAVLEETKTK